jgi:pimeloyl-ACP methyl ester carboxylesterase
MWLLLILLLVLPGCDRRDAETDRQPAADRSERSKLAPSRVGYLEVGNARFYYQVYGDLRSPKTPLLVLHGAYMTSEAMAPLIAGLVGTRPVIAFDARGHGRTGDLPGPITYEQLADDAAGVLDALHVRRADVLGYSMGANTAIAMAVRHPDHVTKQIILSGTSRRDGWYPEVNQALARATPEAFAGTPLEAEYRRVSPTPGSFPMLVRKLRILDGSNYDRPDDAVRAIEGKTMIVVGDADSVDLDHAIALFELRGGGDRKVAVQGFMRDAPRARLAVLPGTAHIGIMANAALIAELAVPFLDDTTPAVPPGFLAEPGQRR